MRAHRKAKLITVRDLQMKVAPDEGWRDPRESSPLDDDTLLAKAYGARGRDVPVNTSTEAMRRRFERW